VAGARWAQDELLAKNAKADVRVFAVWFKMYPADAPSKWSSELLADRRVEHRWDESKAAGRWFLTNLSSLHPSRGGDGVSPQRVDVLWDAYLLFGRDATWNDTPNGVLSWGHTVIRTRAKLHDDFEFVIKSR
jgi:hypothetical protein